MVRVKNPYCHLCHQIRCTCPAPSAEPQMPEGWEFVPHNGGFFVNEGLSRVLSMSRLTTLLATQGLTIVPVASVVTAEEREVLEAMGAIPQVLLESCHQRALEPTCRDAWTAELARRAAKGDKAP